jgi:hypothetical protein
METSELAFISDPEQILPYLEHSKVEGTVVGISAPILGNGIFLTGIEDIRKQGEDFIIVLKGYDVTGYILERNKISLNDIRAICPFKSPFNNPYLRELTGERFYEIR